MRNSDPTLRLQVLTLGPSLSTENNLIIFTKIDAANGIERRETVTRTSPISTDLLRKHVSEQAVQASWNIAAGASATASLACVPTWHEDFRNDLSRERASSLKLKADRKFIPTRRGRYKSVRTSA